MENEIGIGAIIGLVVASTFYVWYTDDLTQGQKMTLVVLIIFPPLQWLLIVVFLIYNGYAQNTLPEVKAKQKVESDVYNLSDLKQKGILTYEEYNQKVSKINAEKDEQELKNSVEYKQLKSLLDSNILTKEEFESKTKLLKSKPKEVIIEDVFYTSDNIEKEALGNFRVDGILYSFYHQNILEIDYGNNTVKGKWIKIDDSTLELKFLIVRTKFYNVQFSNNKISYINKGVKYFGKRVK